MNYSLGIFDSGVGGFTVLKRVLERHGQIKCLYLGDTKRIPYGDKTPLEIREIALEIAQWFNHEKVSAVLVACNTTNSIALDVLQKISDVPVFGLIEGVQQMIHEKKIGVLATSATIHSGAYKKQIKKYLPDTLILEQACPAFVPLIESRDLQSNEIRKRAFEYLKPLIDEKVEAIVLGCSHYPLLEPLLRELLPSSVRLIDPAIGLAFQVDKILGKPKESISKNHEKHLNTRFCVTSDPSEFLLRARYWSINCPKVELISLRSKAFSF